MNNNDHARIVPDDSLSIYAYDGTFPEEIVMQHSVFVNRVLNMKKIKYIGLDMDHTLIRYNTEAFESLVYKLVIQKLIQVKKYPTNIQQLEFHFQDVIRGLVIDSKHGNILKLSRYGAIRESYHGTKHIAFSEQKAMYRSTYVDLGDPDYFAIDTAFSLAFCALYGQLIDLKDQTPRAFPDYQTIALDVLATVDEVHSEGNLKYQISQNLDAFIIKDPKVVEGLLQYARQGKKIFILTNSDYAYSKLLLDYAITPFLPQGQTWQDLFEYVITLANKPRFFYDNLKFLSINPETGTMTNVHGKISPGLYQGGNARTFTDNLSLTGDEILYIGDHIYGDILRLKKDCNWRTALIVEELGREIASQIKVAPLEKQIGLHMQQKALLEDQALQLHDNPVKNQARIQELQKETMQLDLEIADLLQKQQAFFNPTWGRIFRTGAEESYFAHQVDRFACIYMEKLEDLLSHSPLTYFRAYRRLLAHDQV